MSWRPILEGAAAARAIDAALSIARALADGFPESPGVRLPLLHADVALLQHYAELAAPGRGAAGARDRFLARAAEGVAATELNASLYLGFTGVAWVHTHVDPCGGDPEDVGGEIDGALIDAVERAPGWQEFDLINGLVGLGVYSLERLPRPRARQLLALVIDRLERLARPGPGGAFWWTPAALLSAEQRAACPDGHANLGLAHGIAGVIGLLGGACAAGVETRRAEALLCAAIGWLEAQRLPDEAPSSFPKWIAPGQPPQPARAAWCYGDPGIAAALLLAADGCARDDWRQRALAIARRAACRPAASTGAFDGGLCHGTSGLGHIFNRLHQASGDPLLLAAARAWHEKTLAMRRDRPDVLSYFPWVARELGPVDDGSWNLQRRSIDGVVGVALALLAAATPIAPAWDRLFLLSSSSARGR